MTSFGWKRKVGGNVSREISLQFSFDSEVETPSENVSATKIKRRKQDTEENRTLKNEELKAEGIQLAQNNRFEEAVVQWDKALCLVPTDEKTLEMKAQALLQLNNPFPAVQAAERAVKLNPRWWVAYQTLGRSQLGIGDLKMAKISFSKAIHLNPNEKELWDDDLKWTLNLIDQKSKIDSDTSLSEKSTNQEQNIS